LEEITVRAWKAVVTVSIERAVNENGVGKDVITCADVQFLAPKLSEFSVVLMQKTDQLAKRRIDAFVVVAQMERVVAIFPDVSVAKVSATACMRPLTEDDFEPFGEMVVEADMIPRWIWNEKTVRLQALGPEWERAVEIASQVGGDPTSKVLAFTTTMNVSDHELGNVDVLVLNEVNPPIARYEYEQSDEERLLTYRNVVGAGSVDDSDDAILKGEAFGGVLDPYRRMLVRTVGMTTTVGTTRVFHPVHCGFPPQDSEYRRVLPLAPSNSTGTTYGPDKFFLVPDAALRADAAWRMAGWRVIGDAVKITKNGAPVVVRQAYPPPGPGPAAPHEPVQINSAAVAPRRLTVTRSWAAAEAYLQTTWMHQLLDYLKGKPPTPMTAPDVLMAISPRDNAACVTVANTMTPSDDEVAAAGLQ